MLFTFNLGRHTIVMTNISSLILTDRENPVLLFRLKSINEVKTPEIFFQ